MKNLHHHRSHIDHSNMKPKAFKFLKNNLLLIILPIYTLLIFLSQSDLAYISSHVYTNFLRRIPADDQKSQQQEDPCLGRYIYMHKLPPRFNQDLLNHCETLRKKFNFCPYIENGGFGSSLKPDSYISESSEGWYDTHQSILEVFFHTRMKQYECLTENSSLASAIYAPFYPGLEAGRYLWGDYNASVKDAGGLDFTRWLSGQPEWGRMFGFDHFFVSGRIAWDFRRVPNYIGPENWGTKLMYLEETKNTTLLSVESSSHHDNDFAIPYPTNFHPSNESEILQWQERVEREERTHLFAFAGGPHYLNTSIRWKLINQCSNAPDHCKLVGSGSSNPRVKYISITPYSVINSFLKSDFCLQPPGDSPTRRSTFDAILAGCIPVFFHPASAYTQYFWHLPKNYTKYSIFIPEQGLKNGTVNVKEALMQIPRADVIAMRKEVMRIIPRVIYAHNKLETTEDAFDLTIRGVLKRIKEFRGQIEQGKDPRTQFPEDYSWKYHLTGNVQKHKWDPFYSDSKSI